MCLALVGLGCASAELQDSRRQLEAAEAHNASLERRRLELHGQWREARGRLEGLMVAGGRDYQRTLAAAAFLKGEEAGAEELAALDGFHFEEALSRGDLTGVNALVERATEHLWRCAERADAGPPSGDPGCECDLPRYEDECAGVEDQVPAMPRWTCSGLVSSAQGLPPAVFCTAPVLYPAASSEYPSRYAESFEGRSLPAHRELIRTAFMQNTRLVVADYPSPAPELYAPPNTFALQACARQTAVNACRYRCEERFGRYQDPCGCADGPQQPEEADGGALFEGCMAGCGERSFEEPEPPGPRQVKVSVRLESSPTPGVLIAQVDRSYLGDGDAPLGLRTFTWVLHNEALAAGAGGMALSAAPLLSGLRLIAEYEDERSPAQAGSPGAPLRAIAWSYWPGSGEPVLVALQGQGVLSGLLLQRTPAQLDAARLCQASLEPPLPERFRAYCPDAGSP